MLTRVAAKAIVAVGLLLGTMPSAAAADPPISCPQNVPSPRTGQCIIVVTEPGGSRQRWRRRQRWRGAQPVVRPVRGPNSALEGSSLLILGRVWVRAAVLREGCRPQPRSAILLGVVERLGRSTCVHGETRSSWAFPSSSGWQRLRTAHRRTLGSWPNRQWPACSCAPSTSGWFPSPWQVRSAWWGCRTGCGWMPRQTTRGADHQECVSGRLHRDGHGEGVPELGHG